MKKILLILSILLLTSSCGAANSVKTSKLYGVKTYVLDEYNMPQVLGKPKLTNEEVQEYSKLDNEQILEKVDSYIDILRINSLKSYSDRMDNSDLFKWANKHFDKVGIIATQYLNELNKMIYGKLVYVVVDDFYCLMNIARDIDCKEWLKSYKGENAMFNSSEELKRGILDNYPTNFYLIEIIEPGNYILFDNGETSYKTISRNAECYEYMGYKLPLALGTPKLNEKEITNLVKSDDYKLIEDTIDNIGDAVAFIEAADIVTQFDFANISYVGGFSVDNGNNWYDDEHNVVYSCSGAEIIKLGKAQCSAMATLINFLLYDDFEALGYVCGHGHAINYIKGNDNRYYLIDGSDIVGMHKWLYGHSIDGNADTLEELMNEYYTHPTPGYNGDARTAFMISWEYDGVWCFSEKPKSSSSKEFVFPNGTKNVNIWEKNMDTTVSYFEPKHRTDHYNFIFR